MIIFIYPCLTNHFHFLLVRCQCSRRSLSRPCHWSGRTDHKRYWLAGCPPVFPACNWYLHVFTATGILYWYLLITTGGITMYYWYLLVFTFRFSPSRFTESHAAHNSAETWEFATCLIFFVDVSFFLACIRSAPIFYSFVESKRQTMRQSATPFWYWQP